MKTPAARLTAWLREAQRGGHTSVYWNASHLSVEDALARAGRLPLGATVDMQTGQVFVVEPLCRP